MIFAGVLNALMAAMWLTLYALEGSDIHLACGTALAVNVVWMIVAAKWL